MDVEILVVGLDHGLETTQLFLKRLFSNNIGSLGTGSLLGLLEGSLKVIRPTLDSTQLTLELSQLLISLQYILTQLLGIILHRQKLFLSKL